MYAIVNSTLQRFHSYSLLKAGLRQNFEIYYHPFYGIFLGFLKKTESKTPNEKRKCFMGKVIKCISESCPQQVVYNFQKVYVLSIFDFRYIHRGE